MIDTGHWIYNKDFNVEDYWGFVYLVTNINTDRKYIGKKSFWSVTTKKVNMLTKPGKKNTKVKKESKWRTYTTSSETINREILLGEQFTFEILTLHKSKGSLAYNEVYQIVIREALTSKFDNDDREYYNGNIPAIKFIPKDD